MVAILLFVGMFVFMLIGVPIVYSIGAASVLTILIADIPVPLSLVVQRMFTGINSFPLICIPFFVLAGEIMGAGGVSQRLIKLAQLFVGRVRGGLAMVNCLDSMMFGGISGSSCADVSSLGSIVIPAMVDEGYDRDFAVALTASTATIGIIIPPSNVMIIYATVATMVSIADLFLAGIIPGILVGVSMMVLCYFIAVKRGYPREPKLPWREKVRVFIAGVPPLFSFLIIMGGILGGIFTPTESAVIAVVYNLILSMLFYKTVKLKDLPRLLLNTGITTSAVLTLIGISSVFSWLLAYSHVPDMIVSLMLSLSSNMYVLLLLMLLVFLLVGMIMDDAAALIIFVPMFLSVAVQLGMSPVHFGLFAIIALAIGQYTPPVGAVLFLSCKIGKISIAKVTPALIPFILVELFVVLLVMFFEPITMWIPTLVRSMG